MMSQEHLFMPKSFEDIETVKKKLKECKDEWLERKPGKGNVTYIGHNTIRQILDNAVKGITYWDFGIIDQWREEIYAYNKNTGQYYFDGYVYHVKGYLYIPGIGRREQFGSKVAIGGKDNQNSAYKAAASNCFAKCASLFGVGEDIYSKIKIEDDEENMQINQQQYQQQYQQSYPQNTQQMQQQANWNQGQQQWQQQNNNWNQQQQWNQQGAYQQSGNFNHGQQPYSQQTYNTGVGQQSQYITAEDIQREVDNMSPDDIPFNVDEKQAAEPKPEATPSEYQAVENEQISQPENQQSNTQSQGTNPWQEQGVIEELQKYAAHKKRLNINDDNLMIPYLRDYFKDENADFNTLTPENLGGFNKYLESITV